MFFQERVLWMGLPGKPYCGQGAAGSSSNMYYLTDARRCSGLLEDTIAFWHFVLFFHVQAINRYPGTKLPICPSLCSGTPVLVVPSFTKKNRGSTLCSPCAHALPKVDGRVGTPPAPGVTGFLFGATLLEPFPLAQCPIPLSDK